MTRDRRRRWAPRVNGRRGTYLMLKSTIFLMLGLTYVIPAPTSGTARSLGFITALGLPLWVAGLPWLGAGLVGVAGAFRRPPGSDGWAFAILGAVASAWAVIYVIGWLGGSSPRGYFLALIFAALAGATLLVSGMVDARDLMQQVGPEVES